MKAINVTILDDKEFRKKYLEFRACAWSPGARVPDERMVPPVLYDARTGVTYVHKSSVGAA